MTRIYLERGATWTFAVALDWPGWCRRARSVDEALEALKAYRARYEGVIGHSVDHDDFLVVDDVVGTTTTDFGAPDVSLGLDEDVTFEELTRHLSLLERQWDYFDEVVARAPALLRKGPRGGGRDRDAVAAHVREAERHYAAKCGLRVAPRTDWNVQRTRLLETLRSTTTARWPVAYAIRRIAWHVTDHAWEIEDRSTGQA